MQTVFWATVSQRWGMATTGWGDTRGRVGFGSDHVGGVLWVTRGSSTRGRQGRSLLWRSVLFEWAAGLDIARGRLETGGTLIQVAIDTDVTEFPTLEAGFVITGMVMGKGCIVVTASPPDFGMSDSNFFFFGQGWQQGGGGGVLRSCGSFFNEVLSGG